LDNVPLEKDKMFIDKKTERQIFGKFVICPNEGCDWRNCLSLVVEHLRKCPLEFVSCPLSCGIDIKRNFIQEHTNNHCCKRIITCPHCHNPFIFDEYEEKHVENCPDELIECINQCGEKVMRKDMEKHRDRSCEEEMVMCMFEDVGCDWKMKRKDEREHMVSLMVEHMWLLKREVKLLTEENRLKSKEIDYLKATVVNQTKQIMYQSEEIESLKSNLKNPSKDKRIKHNWTWNRCGENIIIDNTSIEQYRNGYSIAIGNTPVQSFSVEIEYITPSKWEVVVGVALKDIDLNDYLSSTNKGWAYTNQGLFRHNSGDGGEDESISFGTGDVITVKLSNQKVLFYKNGRYVGSLDCYVSPELLYPAVQMFTTGNVVSIVYD
jgi:hypothetical protein